MYSSRQVISTFAEGVCDALHHSISELQGLAARGMTNAYLLLKVLGGLCLLAAFLWTRVGRQRATMPLVRGLPYGQRAPLRPSLRAR